MKKKTLKTLQQRILTLSSIICFAAGILFLSGCAATELENKIFPLAVLIDERDGKCLVSYLSQNLSQIANENADGENATSGSAAGSTYYEAQKTFEKNNRCQLDLSHTKALIFQKSFLETGGLPQFLETVQHENAYARNTPVFLTDSSMKAMAGLNSSLEVPLGSFLEQMIENEQDIKEQAAATLAALLNEQANKNRTVLIPILKEENGIPVIHSYSVMQDFMQKGQISAEEARIYYLLENQLRQMDLQLASGEQVHLTGLRCKRKFFTKAELEAKMNAALSKEAADAPGIISQISISANAQQITGKDAQTKAENRTGSEIESGIKELLRQKIHDACYKSQKTVQADLADSYRYLARHAPGIYRIYKDRQEAFREKMDYSIQVRVKLL